MVYFVVMVVSFNDYCCNGMYADMEERLSTDIIEKIDDGESDFTGIEYNV